MWISETLGAWARSDFRRTLVFYDKCLDEATPVHSFRDSYHTIIFSQHATVAVKVSGKSKYVR